MDNITDDMRKMARGIIPENASENQQDLLELAICQGMLLERERVESERRIARFMQSIERLKASKLSLVGAEK